MIEQPCPPQQGLWFAHPYVQRYDWAWLCRYQADNRAQMQSSPPDVVFIGDSITEGWRDKDPQFFIGGHVSRGISGQTSPQLLVRFSQDVIALRPRAVHIMIGTNDIAGNSGPNNATAYQNNIRAMVTLARANGIAVILGSILPADHFGWNLELHPAQQIIQMNIWLRDYARQEHLVFADYHAALATPEGALNPAYSLDGVHPEYTGYVIMRPIADAAIDCAINHRSCRA